MVLEDEVIDSRLLTKLRCFRLQDMNLLDLLIGKTVENGLLLSKIVSVDTTHTKVRFKPKSPKDFLQEKLKLLRKAVYQAI